VGVLIVVGQAASLAPRTPKELLAGPFKQPYTYPIPVVVCLDEDKPMNAGSFKVICSFFIGLVVALTGCSIRDGGKPNKKLDFGPLFPVKGKVMLGEKHLETGIVTFIPLATNVDMPRPKGYIDFNGFYDLKTALKEGAPPGKYRVTVQDNPTKGQRKPKFDPIYANEAKSPLEIEVVEKAPDGAYDLKVKRPED
jgi:hypothetical protein